MTSIDSVNILISPNPSMHSEVPYPTPTLVSLVWLTCFLQQIPTLQRFFFQSSFSQMKWLYLKVVCQAKYFASRLRNVRNLVRQAMNTQLYSRMEE